jgi:hypothetical protein
MWGLEASPDGATLQARVVMLLIALGGVKIIRNI